MPTWSPGAVKPVLPSAAPTRLWPWLVNLPPTSLGAVTAWAPGHGTTFRVVFLAMMLLNTQKAASSELETPPLVPAK